MLEPLLFLIGLAGVAFIIYAFHVMKLLNRTARILAISGLMLLIILFGNRIFALGQVRTVPNQFPFFDNPSVSPRAVRGWQETPFIVLELILAEIGNLNGGSVPASPSPSLSPSPASPSPAPPTPASPSSPSLSPSPAPSPAQPAPSPSPTPAQPSPQPSPDPYPDRYPDSLYPDNPYPGDPYPVPSPYPTPTPYPDKPAPDYGPPDEPQPSKPRPQPIPGWW